MFEYIKIYIKHPNYFFSDVKTFFSRKFNKYTKNVLNKLIDYRINYYKSKMYIYNSPTSIIMLILEKMYDNTMMMGLKGLYSVYENEKLYITFYLDRPGQLIGIYGHNIDNFKKECERIFEVNVELDIKETK